MQKSYFDLPLEFSNYKDAKIAILPAPFEATTSYAKGACNAPKAILEASTQVELYDEELDFEAYHTGVTSLASLNFANSSIEDSLNLIHKSVKKILEDNKTPITIGGEHSISFPCVKAAKEKFSDLTVVQFDAHADLRNEYEGTKWSHASVMARILELCPAVQVGIRNLSIEEAHLVKENQLPVFFAYKIFEDNNWLQKVLSEIKTKNVYITFDVDAFDSSIMPDTGTPEPGGLNWWQVTKSINTIARQKNIIGMDFVELSPKKEHHASDFLVAKLIYKAIGCLVKYKK